MAVHSVVLMDGLLVFDEARLESEIDTGLFDKLRLFVEQLQSVVEMTPRGALPNVTFLMTASSLPFLDDMPRNPVARIAWARTRAPVLSIAKRDGDGDVLVPNPYFGDLPTWDAEMRRLVRHANAKYPWGGRLHKLHWRGSCSAKFDGVLPRLRVLLRWAGTQGFDIAFSNQCLSRLWANYKPERSLTKEEIKATGTLHKRRLEVDDMGKFRYLLHMPGASSGSYSRSLQYQVLSGAAILKFDNPYKEFYYAGLAEGTHFLGVNVTNLGEVARYLRDHDDVARALGSEVQRYALHVLAGAHLAGYWRQVLATHARLQRFKTTLPVRGCTCPGKGPHARAALEQAPAALQALPRCKQLKCDRLAPASSAVAAAQVQAQARGNSTEGNATAPPSPSAAELAEGGRDGRR